MDKMVEKMVAREFSQYCENYSKLHQGQIKDRKVRSAIDTFAILVHAVQENGSKKSEQ